jgi:hypothetical protein
MLGKLLIGHIQKLDILRMIAQMSAYDSLRWAINRIATTFPAWHLTSPLTQFEVGVHHRTQLIVSANDTSLQQRNRVCLQTRVDRQLWKNVDLHPLFGKKLSVLGHVGF